MFTKIKKNCFRRFSFFVLNNKQYKLYILELLIREIQFKKYKLWLKNAKSLKKCYNIKMCQIDMNKWQLGYVNI